MPLITDSMILDLNKMKTFLNNEDSKTFTRRDFLNNTYSSSYYFNQMLDIGLIINTGETKETVRGNPIVYKLNNLILDRSASNRYNLSSEDIKILLEAKNNKLSSLNTSLEVMKNEVKTLKEEKEVLTRLKNDSK